MPSSNFQTTFPIILVLLLALMLVTMPTNAQNPIANSYFCRMRCDASFNACVNQMGKSIYPIPSSSSPPNHYQNHDITITPYHSGRTVVRMHPILSAPNRPSPWVSSIFYDGSRQITGYKGTNPIGRSVQRLAQCEGVRRVCYCWC